MFTFSLFKSDVRCLFSYYVLDKVYDERGKRRYFGTLQIRPSKLACFEFTQDQGEITVINQNILYSYIS